MVVMSWKHCIAAVLLTGGTVMQAHACFDPLSVYSIGIVFTRGETIHAENIEEYGDESASFIKVCEKGSGNAGQSFLTATMDGKPVDPVVIDSAWLKLNTLYLAVHYGGGCRVHTFNLYTDGVVTDTPQAARLFLSHDAQGDNCKAIVRETLVFNLDGLSEKKDVEIVLYAPGQTVPYTPAPVWNQAYVDAQRCSYKMRSAYSKSAMAYIGRYIGYSGTGATTYNQLLVIFDSTRAVPTAEEKVAALKAEINRLEGMDVLSLTEPQITSLGEQLTTINGGQYWTAEDTVLQFNQWFNGDGVNGVRSVYGAKGGCGAGVEYEIPEGTLGTVSVTRPHASTFTGEACCSMRLSLQKGVLNADFAPVRGPAQLVITALDGSVVFAVPLTAGTGRATLDRAKQRSLTRGCYIASLHENGRVVQSTLFSLLH